MHVPPLCYGIVRVLQRTADGLARAGDRRMHPSSTVCTHLQNDRYKDDGSTCGSALLVFNNPNWERSAT